VRAVSDPLRVDRDALHDLPLLEQALPAVSPTSSACRSEKNCELAPVQAERGQAAGAGK